MARKKEYDVEMLNDYIYNDDDAPVATTEQKEAIIKRINDVANELQQILVDAESLGVETSITFAVGSMQQDIYASGRDIIWYNSSISC